jgi:hypothetical protein
MDCSSLWLPDAYCWIGKNLGPGLTDTTGKGENVSDYVIEKEGWLVVFIESHQ